VVGAHDLGKNLRSFYFWHELLGDKKVIDTPAYVALASIGPMSPPGVVSIAFVKKTEGVDKPGFDNKVDALALLFGKAMLALIRLRVG